MNAVITGGTKGIGRAIAEKFAQEGIHLAICSRNTAELNQTKIELQEINKEIEVLVFKADLGKKAEALAFANMVKECWAHIDILVNNAGIFEPGEILYEEEGKLELQMEINLYSAYHLTRACIPFLLKSKNAYIFNMCSIASILAYPNGGSYSISKFALYGFSKVLREELKPKGIKVSSILPGATWSDSWSGSGISKDRIMEANDIAIAIWSAIQMSPKAVMEDIILRPQLGDL